MRGLKAMSEKIDRLTEENRALRVQTPVPATQPLPPPPPTSPPRPKRKRTGPQTPHQPQLPRSTTQKRQPRKGITTQKRTTTQKKTTQKRTTTLFTGAVKLTAIRLSLVSWPICVLFLRQVFSSFLPQVYCSGFNGDIGFDLVGGSAEGTREVGVWVVRS